MSVVTKAVCLMLLVSACSGGGGEAEQPETSTAISQVTTASSTTIAVAPTTTTVLTTTTISRAAQCLAFRDQIVPHLVRTTEQLQESQQDFIDAADGLISFDELADSSLLAADTFGQIADEVSALGTPPPALAEAVRLFIRASERLEEAYELAARGARTESVAMLEEAIAATAEGTTFLVAANQALPSSCS